MKYDKKYYDNLKSQHKETAEKINTIRWNFVKDIPFNTVLDYGCGCGELSFYLPCDKKNVIVDSYDIGFLNGEKYPQTGIMHNEYDLIFFNDVLEHVDWSNNPDEDILRMIEKTKFISISVPVWNDLSKNIKEWKHYKPEEHLTYFNTDSIMRFFYLRGFFPVKSGYPECPPREDIFSAVFKK